MHMKNKPCRNPARAHAARSVAQRRLHTRLLSLRRATSRRASTPRQGEDHQSPYLETLASMPADFLLQRQEPPPYVYEPIYYFFYGTLMKPEILKDVLGLDTEPVLRNAKIYGYELTHWGQYRALVDGKPGQVVMGRAYIVRSVEEEYKLAYYETDAYTLAPCQIYLDGEEEGRSGKVFIYAGDSQALKNGRFDRALWQRRMGKRLPPQWGK